MSREHHDSPDLTILALAGLFVLIIVLAIFGVVDMDDTKTNQTNTVPDAVYVHKEAVREISPPSRP